MAVSIALLAPLVQAEQPNSDAAAFSVASRYPAGAIKSVEDADRALAEVAKERAEIASRYVSEEQACHPKFFATSCIEEAQERRRKATMALRAVEIEANVFKRRARVEARDKALEERNAAAGREGAERAARQQEAENTKTAQEAPVRQDGKPPRKAQNDIFSDRQQKHDARMARLKAEEAAKAKERAENVEDYERKVQAAKARQDEVAKRKAEKEQKRRLQQSQTQTPATSGPSQ
ncbi:MAG TPA: hypothetical protein VGE12_15585 [Noviherbaspirillum sp.]